MSPQDSRVMDANAEALGVSVTELMGNAGRAVADFLDERFRGKRVLFVCGPGNNGGDGFAAASLMDPSTVSVALLKKPSDIHTDAAWHFYSQLRCPILEYSKVDLDSYDVIVDCALGTGMKGNVREPYRGFIAATEGRGNVVSVDVPSGLGSDVSVLPVATVTFHDMKEGMTRENSGEIVISDIGIPAEAVDVVGPGDMLRYPVPGRDSHKGENGRLMIIAGGPYFGAPMMASMSALRVGTDMVRLYVPESVHQQVSSASPVLMVTALPGDRLTCGSVDLLLEESAGYDAVLIGPGLGTDPDTREAVRRFVSGCARPMVIDADGLTAVAGMTFDGNVVLTPHRREFRNLGGSCCPNELAEKLNATVLLKGANDEISDGRRTRLNRTGTPAMTGAGTGDVLAGAVAGLLAKGMTPFDSACLAAYICGKAGEYAFTDKSYGLIATDIVEEIPHVLRDLLR